MRIRTKSQKVLFDLDGSLAGARFKGVQFEDVDLEGRDLRGAVFEECYLALCTLDDADLSESQFLHCEFEGALAIGTAFDRAVIWNTLFYDVHADQARFRHATLRDVRFQGTFLGGCDFTGADLRGTLFAADNISHRTDLTAADFTAANLVDVRFDGALYSPGTRFPDNFRPEQPGLVFEEDDE